MPRRGAGSAALVGLLVGLAALGAGTLAQLFAWSGSWLERAELSAGSVAALGLLLARPLVERVARWKGGPAAPAAAWGGVAVGALALALTLAVGLDDVFTSPYAFLSPSGIFWELEPEAFLVPMVAAVAAALWHLRAARPLAGPGPRLVRRLAFAGVLAAGALAFAAGLRAARAPTPGDYLTSLEVVGWGRDLWDLQADLGAGREDHRSQLYVDERVGSFTLRRYLFGKGYSLCVARLALSAGDLPPSVGWPVAGEDLVPCGPVGVRRAARHRTLFVGPVKPGRYDHAGAAFDERSLARLGPDASVNLTFSDGMAAPPSWVFASTAMLLLALGALALPSRAARWIRLRERWRQGQATEEGRVVLDDGEARLLALGAGVPSGPVVMLDLSGDERAAASPFRHAKTGGVVEAEAVLPGTIAELMTALRAEQASRDAYALAAAALAAAPLLAAASVGLVF